MQEIINEKSRLENEYQKLNTVYEQTTNEQNDLLVLCSTYEDQLKICRNLIQSAGLTVQKFIEKKNFFCFFFINNLLFRYQIFYLNLITMNDHNSFI
jgi:hypothetical protein